MLSTITLLGTDWKINGEDLNIYMKNLANNNSDITEIILDLSQSGFTTQTDYYSIIIPNNLTAFTIIGKNTNDTINNIYASLIAEGGGETYFNCTVKNLGLSAEDPSNDEIGVFIDVASDIPEYSFIAEGNTLKFVGNNNIIASKTGSDLQKATYNAAIHIAEGKRLSIYFDDDNTILNCDGSGVDLETYNQFVGSGVTFNGAAGIGGNSGESAGNIIMYTDGTINIKGGLEAAGIGGGSLGSGGIIQINGLGNLTSTGGEYGAGIGGGTNGTSGTIQINTFGTIKATGGSTAAGIGSGFKGVVEIIEINSMGNVVAQGGVEGAGIGSGSQGIQGIILINVIVTLTAIGGINGAGIGGGYRVSGGIIEVKGSGDVITVGGMNGAGIGGGYNGSVGKIEISGAITLGSTGGINAAGIGAGANGTVGEIKIIGTGEVSSNGIGVTTEDDIGSGNNDNINEIKNRIIIYPLISLTPGKNRPPIKQVAFKKDDGISYVGRLLIRLKYYEENKIFISSTDEKASALVYADHAIVDIMTIDEKFIAKDVDLSNLGDEIILVSIFRMKTRGVNLFI